MYSLLQARHLWHTSYEWHLWIWPKPLILLSQFLWPLFRAAPHVFEEVLYLAWLPQYLWTIWVRTTMWVPSVCIALPVIFLLSTNLKGKAEEGILRILFQIPASHAKTFVYPHLTIRKFCDTLHSLQYHSPSHTRLFEQMVTCNDKSLNIQVNKCLNVYSRAWSEHENRAIITHCFQWFALNISYSTDFCIVVSIILYNIYVINPYLIFNMSIIILFCVMAPIPHWSLPTSSSIARLLFSWTHRWLLSGF